MTVGIEDPAVQDYLARLRDTAAALPPGRREELLGEIQGHIGEALASAGRDDQVTVQQVLDRLGEPEDIVAAELDGRPPVPPVAGPRGADTMPFPPGTPIPVRPSTTLELAAMLMLTLGSALIGIGWLIGVALLWTSRRWRVREKLLGTLVVPGGPALVLLWLPAVATQECASSSSTNLTTGVSGPMVEHCTGPAVPNWLSLPLALAAIVLPVVVAVVLYRRAVDRAAAEPAESWIPAGGWSSGAGVSGPWSQPPPATGWTPVEVIAVLALTVGAFVLPIVGPLVGIALVWASVRWTRTEKIVATLLGALPMLLLVAAAVVGLLAFSTGGESGTGTPVPAVTAPLPTDSGGTTEPGSPSGTVSPSGTALGIVPAVVPNFGGVR